MKSRTKETTWTTQTKDNRFLSGIEWSSLSRLSTFLKICLKFEFLEERFLSRIKFNKRIITVLASALSALLSGLSAFLKIYYKFEFFEKSFEIGDKTDKRYKPNYLLKFYRVPPAALMMSYSVQYSFAVV